MTKTISNPIPVCVFLSHLKPISHQQDGDVMHLRSVVIIHAFEGELAMHLPAHSVMPLIRVHNSGTVEAWTHYPTDRDPDLVLEQAVKV